MANDAASEIGRSTEVGGRALPEVRPVSDPNSECPLIQPKGRLGCANRPATWDDSRESRRGPTASGAGAFYVTERPDFAILQW